MRTPDLGGNPLSYVANTGMARTANDSSTLSSMGGTTSVPASSTYSLEDVNSGVFFNQAMYTGTSSAESNGIIGNGLKIGPDFISTHDGTTYTIMLSENLQAGNWAFDPSSDPTIGGTTAMFYNSDMAVRANTGMVWFPTGYMNNSLSGQTPGLSGLASIQSTPAVVNSMVINGQAQNVVGSIRVPYQSSTSNPYGLAYSRPSANHSGGVNVVLLRRQLRLPVRRDRLQSLHAAHDAEPKASEPGSSAGNDPDSRIHSRCMACLEHPFLHPRRVRVLI